MVGVFVFGIRELGFRVQGVGGLCSVGFTVQVYPYLGHLGGVEDDIEGQLVAGGLV